MPVTSCRPRTVVAIDYQGLYDHKPAAAFAFFSGAGVGMPGTAGFISDDVLMHALWEEGHAAAITIIFGSAILAVASLNILAKAFFGPPPRVHTPDLQLQERSIMVVLVLLLLGPGLMPQLLAGVAEVVLGKPGQV